MFNTASQEERRKRSRDVRNDYIADRNAYLDKMCPATDKKNIIKNSRQAFRIMKMFQRKKSNFGRITKDGESNTIPVQKRLKTLREHTREPQKYPTQRRENMTAEEIQHYHRQLNLNSQTGCTVSCNVPSKEEIINILKSIKNNKASGNDEVINEVLNYSIRLQKHLIKVIQRFFIIGNLKKMKKQDII
eukprot:snap_masked-scaffold_35-processed-gene-2.41-mRNA-1 protein AED:1.00 eAED:1.00 QI:0/-1/0/0/-1/1/1/0/188